MSGPVAFFRCDASPLIGAGHVMRCLALAEALAEIGWHIGFIVGSETVSTVPALTASGFNIRTLRDAHEDVKTLCDAAAEGTDLVVVDHYGRDAAFERSCRAFAAKILAFDDAAARDHDCDILVDAGASGAAAYADHVPPPARVLAGPAYALVRHSFTARREAALARRVDQPVKEILVSCGATDPNNVTGAVLDALDDVGDDIAVTVVLSSRAPHAGAVRKRLRGKARLVLDVENMAEVMTNADLAIGAAGSTAFERAVLGLPSILLTVADNQRGIARQMVEAGAAVDGGIADRTLPQRLRELTATLLKDGNTRRRLAEAASKLVDGRGGARIAVALLGSELVKEGARVNLQLAAPDDEMWLLKTQQHPETRRYFRNTAAPTADEHHQWLTRTLADPQRLLLIVEVDGKPAGSVRLDRLNGKVNHARHEVAIAIGVEYQNRGIGSAALRLVRVLLPRAILSAVISPDNKASRALFKRAGFVNVATNAYQSVPQAADRN